MGPEAEALPNQGLVRGRDRVGLGLDASGDHVGVAADVAAGVGFEARRRELTNAGDEGVPVGWVDPLSELDPRVRASDQADPGGVDALQPGEHSPDVKDRRQANPIGGVRVTQDRANATLRSGVLSVRRDDLVIDPDLGNGPSPIVTRARPSSVGSIRDGVPISTLIAALL